MSEFWVPKGTYRLDEGTLTVKHVILDSQRSGGSMVGGPARGTIHTTETRGFHQPSSGGSYYHAQIMALTDTRIELRQYLTFQVAARSLRNLSGGVQTNRQGRFHPTLSIVDYAKNAEMFPIPLLNAVAWWMRWCERQFGIKRKAIAARGGGGEAYGYDGPYRMTSAKWVQWDGWSAHQNVPENTHWDAGKIDWAYLIAYGAETVQPEEEEVTVKKGAKGNYVAVYQKALMTWNAEALPVYGADGDYGDETVEWVKRYQSSAGLPVTGEIDWVTGDMLDRYQSKVAPVTVELETEKIEVVKEVRVV